MVTDFESGEIANLLDNRIYFVAYTGMVMRNEPRNEFFNMIWHRPPAAALETNYRG